MLVQRGRFDSPFFRAKFRVPTAPDHHVCRTRLVELLDDLVTFPVTAVVAPAGAGKTALAADWVRCTGRPTAWLTLDESDHEPSRFWATVVAAVEELGEAPGSVLVVDDVHRIDGTTGARRVLEDLVDRRPEWLHLLLVGRRRPPLPVDRLRATGALADIDFEALRLTDAESLAMLSGLCPEAPTDELLPIVRWAGGWAAALQLAALAVRSRRRVPTAPDQLVDSYVWHEVLRAERTELVDLLLSTAVVDRLNYGLAEALTGRPDAGDLLREAEERGLFVTSLDAGGWFGVHGLVRDMLIAELERRWPERLREQHVRAARWFESAGDTATALEHWLEGGEPGEALRLLSAVAVSLVDGGRATEVRRVLDRIPPGAAAADPTARAQDAWCRLLVGAPVDDVAAAGSDALQALAAYASCDWETAIARGRCASVDDPLGRFGWSIVAHAMAATESWDDDHPLVEEARAAVAAESDRRLAHECARAVGLAVAGHTLDAVRAAAGVRPVVESAEMATLLVVLDLADAIAARELGDPEAAVPTLQELTVADCHPSTYVPVLAGLELVEARLATGDVAAAEELVTRLESGGVYAGRVARTAVSVALARQDLTAAERWADRVDDAFWSPLSRARIHLSAGRTSAAVEAAGLAEPRCVRHRVVRELVLARAAVGGDKDAAAKSVAIAADLAADQGLLQTVAAEGPAVLELVELAAWRVPDAWLARLRRALATEPTPVVAAPLVEPLTERERDVLRLLPSRLTLREIAGELFVSQNTLKFHLRVIYRKLGVNSRAGAVDTARQLRLLARG
ncbi:MAG TPA: LuxR C-terminal-related transcriptional regulator [Nocardioides sp.]|nr:LuxR C-terminal-related transcriptional regulator [Nocardioides sp.]